MAPAESLHRSNGRGREGLLSLLELGHLPLLSLGRQGSEFLQTLMSLSSISSPGCQAFGLRLSYKPLASLLQLVDSRLWDFSPCLPNSVSQLLKEACIPVCLSLSVYIHKYTNLYIYICIYICICVYIYISPSGSVDKESDCNEGDTGLIPGSGRCPEEGNGNPLQFSCLENPMDR